MTARPAPSGAHLAKECTDKGCSGYRTYPLPGGGEIKGHCGCAVGRRTAEEDFARRHGAPRPVA